MTEDKDATIARLSEQVNTLTTEKHADAEAIGALEAKLAEVTAAGTYAQGIEAAAGEIRKRWATTHAELEEYVRALSPTPQADDILDDSSLRAQVGELGNQIHSLGCEYQSDERLAERLGELRNVAWGLARVASAAPQAKAVNGLTDNEQKSQAARCPCKGSDDWCPCQNTPDRATRDARESTPQAGPVREAVACLHGYCDAENCPACSQDQEVAQPTEDELDEAWKSGFNAGFGEAKLAAHPPQPSETVAEAALTIAMVTAVIKKAASELEVNWGHKATPEMRDEILKLTPADAQAALEAYGREKVQEGLRKAADIAAFHVIYDDTPAHSVRDGIEAEILAAMEKEAAQ